MKSLLIKPFTKWVSKRVKQDAGKALEHQERIFGNLIKSSAKTIFGKDHSFNKVHDYHEFKEAVPVRDYEGLKSYFDRITSGESDVLWPGKPIYLAKTSGTTSGTKYIPITSQSLPNHISTARNALFNYASTHNRSKLFDGKVMFLSGSPTLNTTGGIKTGRLSGIVNHEIPAWLKGNQLPSYSTNCIEDWEVKVEKIVRETVNADLRLISGIPPWVYMYFERLLDFTGKKSVVDVFPRFQLFMHGGVNYAPYKAAMEHLIGRTIDTIETYPASEGFLAYQTDIADEGLLLNTHSGIFFEFIPLHEYFSENPSRFRLHEVDCGIDYAVIINSNAGLWGYSIGDTVQFISLDPYKVVVSGRVNHFISAFGEHVIAKEVEEALLMAAADHHLSIREFTVAPQVRPSEGGLPYHEWFVEFEGQVKPPLEFEIQVDEHLRKQNAYYDDLISGKILRPLIIRPLVRDAFRSLMKHRGKLGGQNKVPRLSNDRKIADFITNYNLIEQH